MTEDRYKAYSAGFEAGKEAGRLAALRELGIDPDYKPENPRSKLYDEGEFTTGGEGISLEYATQNQRILAYLKAGGVLTPKDALRLFGSFRLSARIFDLRQQGYDIDTEIVQVAPRTWVALFSMPRKERVVLERQLEFAD